jgi:hypothetical protein
MRLSVENTVKNANRQIVERVLKNKELRMTSAELEKLIASLLDPQDNRCALTGIPFQYPGPEADRNLLPSLDRIDSAGHYEMGNLQVVCQFVNFWKGDSDNAEFQRLLMLARGVEQQPCGWPCASSRASHSGISCPACSMRSARRRSPGSTFPSPS